MTWTWCRHDATTSSTQTQFRLLIYFLFFVVEMTAPIQEMTRNRQLREPLSFTPISRHEKVIIIMMVMGL